ncbi:efflux RND transporter permease subunit, partial [Salmonella enterica subsp. enterica serovar Montevideo]|nr:efflux RND transporter permease subunit [Salmonella enterica subsp. enterica serovar Montevideo]
FILGVMPLVISRGAGSGAQNAVGTGVMGGMLTATLLAIFFVPFIPLVVDGKPWQAYPTETIASNRRFFSFEPGAKWHGFEGYA